jgi:recombinational DNA repair ATPase RecF
LFLKRISVLNYKNFSEATFEFDDKINCFVGKNGIGKTNILDAIYHLAPLGVARPVLQTFHCVALVLLMP